MKTKNILHGIFFDENKHGETIVAKHGKNIRPVVLKEVAKFRDCGNIKKGMKKKKKRLPNIGKNLMSKEKVNYIGSRCKEVAERSE